MRLQDRGAPGVSLRQLWPQAQLYGCRDIRVRSCCSELDECRPGDLFVAVDRPAGDGHQDIREALRRGATAVVSERLVPGETPNCVVEDSRAAFAEVCQALSGFPARLLKAVGVTGTSGKTVTAHLIRTMFAAAGLGCGLISSSICDDGDLRQAGSEHGPSAAGLAQSLSRMVANHFAIAVLELSSQALAQRRAHGIELSAAVITNLRNEHLDYHGTRDNYHRAKRQLLDRLSPEGLLVIDGDDTASVELLDRVGHPALSISLQDGGELNAHLIERHAGEQTFLLMAGDEAIPLRTATIGDEHVRSCLLAAAVGLSFGLDLPTVVRGLERTTYVPGRMERIECGQPFAVYVDNAATPSQLQRSLRVIRETTGGRVTCVFGAEGERSQDRRAAMGRVLDRYADRAILTSHNPRFESPLQIAHDLLDGYRRPGRDHVLPDRGEAIAEAIRTARDGDAVLVAGKGDQAYQEIEGVRWAFDDREVCRRVLHDPPRPRVHNQSEPTILSIEHYRR